jgi:putative flippase GtrA
MTAPTRIARLTAGRDHTILPPALRDMVRQARTFALIGVVSTLAYAALYTLLRGSMTAGAANALALVTTAIGNTTANRRLTFGVRGRASLVRDHVAGVAAFVVALVITSSAIAVLTAVAPDAERRVELGVLIGANAVATLVRFLLLRTWVHRGPLPTSAVSLSDRSSS